MGDLANMTDSDGRVDGLRLLRWLHSRAELSAKREGECRQMGERVPVAWYAGRRELLTEMADDLATKMEINEVNCG